MQPMRQCYYYTDAPIIYITIIKAIINRVINTSKNDVFYSCKLFPIPAICTNVIMKQLYIDMSTKLPCYLAIKTLSIGTMMMDF